MIDEGLFGAEDGFDCLEGLSDGLDVLEVTDNYVGFISGGLRVGFEI